MSVTKKTFTPAPELMELTEVFDVKGWMSKIIPAIHDHLKAHQFRFVRVDKGDTRMFYKEWSTDEMWLPSQGISVLEEANQSGELPIEGPPSLVVPTIALDDLQKLNTTVRKVAGYLEKSGAKDWWDELLRKAEEISSTGETSQSPQSQGNDDVLCTD